jgi:hypothetical protein
MKITLQLIIEPSCGTPQTVEEVVQLEREALQPETLGLTLAEAKSLLQGIQHSMTEHQVSEYLQQQSHCPDCGQQRLRVAACKHKRLGLQSREFWAQINCN